jgi:hypothetical protein
MTSYNNSIDALRELLLFPSKMSYSKCSITRISQNVSHLSNGLEYCLVEITCDSVIQYGIQAYGDEAVKLHKEALKHQQQSLENEEKQEEKGNKKQIVTPFVYGISN